MPPENVDIVRRTWEAWSRGDAATARSYLHDELEWDMAEDEPDARTLHGIAEVTAMLVDWFGSFEDFTGTPQEFIDVGQDVVVSLLFTGRPHGGDAVVTLEETQVYTVRGGAIVRVREFRTKAEALAALDA
jgi:ketosteroid isomerase-like protein